MSNAQTNASVARASTEAMATALEEWTIRILLNPSAWSAKSVPEIKAEIADWLSRPHCNLSIAATIQAMEERRP